MLRKLKERLILKWIDDDPVLFYDVAELIKDGCPCFEDCTEQAFENYEPDHNEGYD